MSGILGFITSFPTLLHSAVIFGTVIMFGAMGEILAEKAGNLNLGVPGIMYLGGIAGLIATFMYENVYCVNAGIEPNVANPASCPGPGECLRGGSAGRPDLLVFDDHPADAIRMSPA